MAVPDHNACGEASYNDADNADDNNCCVGHGLGFGGFFWEGKVRSVECLGVGTGRLEKGV